LPLPPPAATARSRDARTLSNFFMSMRGWGWLVDLDVVNLDVVMHSVPLLKVLVTPPMNSG
jgi:hypothetical protein